MLRQTIYHNNNTSWFFTAPYIYFSQQFNAIITDIICYIILYKLYAYKTYMKTKIISLLYDLQKELPP